MKTQLIFISFFLLLNGLLAQNKSILQTQTHQITGLGKLITPKLEKKSIPRNNISSNRHQDILTLAIAENRSRIDTFNSGHEQQPSISVADNTIACSTVDTTDFVVAAKNQRIYFLAYSPNVVTSASLPLQDFSSNHVSNGFIYRNDPKLIYDPVADRYMLVFFYYEIENTAPYFHKVDCKLYVLISTTNDPLNSSWYEIEVTNTDVTSNLNWFDRPQIGVSDEELFIAVNVYDKANNIYQDNLILALKKADLLNGLKTLTVVDIQGNPSTDDLFGMVPVSHAQNKNFGAGLYFLRTDESANLDSVWYYRIPTNVYANPNLTIYKTGIGLNNYERGIKLPQKNSLDSLVVDDSRTLDALYLRNTLHYVFHAKGNTGNNCEVIYNRINLLTDQNTEYRYSSYPSAYPSLASLSYDSTDQTFLIPYLTSDVNSYPSFRVAACDNGGSWSNDLLIHSGDTVKYSGAWGDYIGAARLHTGVLPTCWIYGNYASPNYDEGTESYIAEIILTNPNSIISNIEKQNIRIFPNPTSNYLSVVLPKETKGDVQISLSDIEGRTIQILYEGKAEEAPSYISFPQLSKGIYFVKTAKKFNQIIGYEKIIID